MLAAVLFYLAPQLFVRYQVGQCSNLLEKLSSAVVPLYANGIVSNISGRNVTLTSGFDSLVVPISASAKINLFVHPEGGKSSYYQATQFNKIKTGDHLNINLNLLSDNKLEGKTVYILSSATAKK